MRKSILVLLSTSVLTIVLAWVGWRVASNWEFGSCVDRARTAGLAVNFAEWRARSGLAADGVGANWAAMLKFANRHGVRDFDSGAVQGDEPFAAFQVALERVRKDLRTRPVGPAPADFDSVPDMLTVLSIARLLEATGQDRVQGEDLLGAREDLLAICALEDAIEGSWTLVGQLTRMVSAQHGLELAQSILAAGGDPLAVANELRRLDVRGAVVAGLEGEVAWLGELLSTRGSASSRLLGLDASASWTYRARAVLMEPWVKAETSDYLDSPSRLEPPGVTLARASAAG